MSKLVSRWRWYHGIGFYLIVQALSAGLNLLVGQLRGRRNLTSPQNVRAYYQQLKRPAYAPPGTLFPVAWLINNWSAIYGLLRVLNTPLHQPGRRSFLVWQALSWLDFVLFGSAAFALRSPVNTFVFSLFYLTFTVASLIIALFRLRDSKVALSLATLVIWLLLAVAISLPGMLWNRDEFYRVGPFTPPPADSPIES